VRACRSRLIPLTVGACSASCGQGQRVSTRTCNGIGECFGSGTNQDGCFIGPCVLTTFWSAWSPCTQTCGNGTQTRSKAAGPGVGSTVLRETQPCSAQACPQWSPWQAWTGCSATCGGGSRSHTRTCVDPVTSSVVPNGCVGTQSEADPAPCNAFGC
jgi:hypothetical protein